MTIDDFTTLLVWLPIGAALVIWILPLSRYATGSLAVLVSLLEVGIWIQQAAHFDFSRGGIQFEQRASWIHDLGVSYHVGEYGFSLWLVGLTVVAMAAAIGYGFWVGRDRPRAYFGLMLFLTGATVGVFVAQDLLLFYAFFEAMLIPLYVLVGVWGGPGRLGATLKFVLYTMAGSLLMLASVVVYGLSQHTFDLVKMGPSSSQWIFLGFAAAFAIKARCSRCTGGCRTRTGSRRPRSRPFFPASSRKRRRMASSASPSRSSPARRTTSALRSSRWRRSASSTARCSHSARATCVA